MTGARRGNGTCSAMAKKGHEAHVLAIPVPAQGHLNPLLQFCKRLVSKGVKATLAVTVSLSNSIDCPDSFAVRLDTISDGYDEGGFASAESPEAYFEGFRTHGSRSVADLVRKYQSLGEPIDCVIHDSHLPWAADVGKELGLVTASFFTQPCAVNFAYYCAFRGMFGGSPSLSIPGLPVLELEDMPSFVAKPESYPFFLEILKNQFSNLDKDDFVYVNTFYKLEAEVIDAMSKFSPFKTIGPAIPSAYLDNRLENDRDYGLSLFPSNRSACTNWLRTKARGSIVYVSFGSVADLMEEQVKELAWGLKGSEHYFLWVLRGSDAEKLPENFVGQASEKGLILQWSPQLEVLSSGAVGCFVSHGGWNSTLEAMSLGVPMVVMPQWTDQNTTAKLIHDVWKVGIRAKADGSGLVRRDVIESCVKEVMEGGERGKEVRRNAVKWKDLAKEAVSEGGSSDENVDEFVFELLNSSSRS